MNLPVMTARVRRSRARFVDYGIVLAGLAAFVTSVLAQIVTSERYVCECEEPVRVSALHGGVPALAIALLTAMRIATGHRGGVVRSTLQILVVAIITLIFLLTVHDDAPGQVAGSITHGLILLLLAVRWGASTARRLRR